MTLEYGSDRLSRKGGEKQPFYAAYNHEKERRYEKLLLKHATHLARKDMSVLLAAFLRKRRLPSSGVPREGEGGVSEVLTKLHLIAN